MVYIAKQKDDVEQLLKKVDIEQLLKKVVLMHLTDDELARLYAGVANEGEKARYEAHLGKCPICQQRYEMMEEVLESYHKELVTGEDRQRAMDLYTLMREVSNDLLLNNEKGVKKLLNEHAAKYNLKLFKEEDFKQSLKRAGFMHLTDDELARLYDGTADDRERAMSEAHLKKCLVCNMNYGVMRDVLEIKEPITEEDKQRTMDLYKIIREVSDRSLLKNDLTKEDLEYVKGLLNEYNTKHTNYKMNLELTLKKLEEIRPQIKKITFKLS